MLVMRKNNIEITNDDIKFAEKTLLPKWWKFDDERKNFIKNLDTIDLEAVPGSGKTTALLAKLLILERKMPFENGAGILVLSHTNTAVDEIKNKLEKIAPKLFKHPNFIGTIQSFVDTFLTKPYGLSFLNINFNNIDDDYYNSKMQFEYNHLPYGIKSFIDRNNEPLNFFQNIMLDNENNLTKWPFWNIFLKNSSTSDSYKKIFEVKNNYKQKWIITFDEAYYLAFCYLEKFPKIIKILQKRFWYVFVDEMQDMEQHQADILERLFYKKYTFNHCFQRIWDKNQAIYSGFEANEIDNSKIWKRKILKIEWSHRLTQNIANVVNCFQIEWETKIIWRNNLEKWDIKPIMIVYEDKDLNNERFWDNKILQEFWKIIEKKREWWYFKNIPSDKFICKAVISNAKLHDDWFKPDKCRAKHYFHEYDENFQKSKTSNWLKSLKDYLCYYDKNDISLNSKYKNILRLFLRILKENNVENFYKKEQLFLFLREKHPQKLLEFKDKIYYFCKSLNNENIENISKEIDEYFSDFIFEVWEKFINPWVSDSLLSKEITKINDKEVNIFEYNWIKISVCTTHSVKGETHTCTLYMESSNKYYEIEQIKEEKFLWNNNSILSKTWNKFSKLIYVWFSRPTHLLCFAISKTRFNKYFKASKDVEKLKEYWEIQEIEDKK